MSRSAKPRWLLRSVAAPILLSLTIHGLLLLALWNWPTRTRSPALSIESTRITLDSCVLDSRSATLLSPPEMPAELLGPDVNTTLAPRLEGDLATGEHHASRSQAPLGSARERSSDSPPAPTKGREAELPGRRSPSELGSEGHEGSGNLFSLPATASSVVFVLDRSLTMGIGRKLGFARGELIASLRRLPPSVRFQVIDYNDFAESLIVDGQRDLLPAEPAIVEKAILLLEALDAAGATNHFAALRRGLDLHPDVLYFLTDADDLTPEVIAAITQRNQRSVIHTIELTQLRTGHSDGPLAKLARDNHGTYIYRRVAFGDSP